MAMAKAITTCKEVFYEINTGKTTKKSKMCKIVKRLSFTWQPFNSNFNGGNRNDYSIYRFKKNQLSILILIKFSI